MISALRALCAVLLVILPGVAQAQAWCNNASVCNSSWTRREQLVFNDVSGTANQTNFTVMVRINSSRFDMSAFKANGDDLRFFAEAAGTTVLPYEIEVWNPSGDSIVWVRYPSLTVAGSTSAGNLWMYWGNQTASAGQDTTGAVWHTDYRAVWHLQDLTESTDESGTLTATNAVTATGKIGGGYDFDGNGDYLSVPGNIDLGNWLGENDVMLEVWMKSSDIDSADTSVSNAPGITGIYDSSGNVEVAFGWIKGDTSTLRVSGDGDTGQGITDVLDGNWHYVVMGRDPEGPSNPEDGRVRIWRDGTRIINDVVAGGNTEAANFSDFGRILNSSDSYLGSLDEIRVRSGVSGDSLVAANYMAQNDTLINWCSSPSTWYTDGDGDTFGGGSSFTSCAQGVNWVATGGDCDDGDPLRNPNTVWYIDADQDNHGSGTPGPTQCADPGGNYVPQGGDCDDSQPLAWVSCATCADADGDFAWKGCDAYTGVGEDCSDANFRAWNTCGTCGDPDTDGHWSGCNQYLNADDGPDLCDGSSSNAIFRNNYGPGCSTCGDDDGDGKYSECDSYVTITRDYCDTDGQPISENNWTQTACGGGCADGDGDGKYSGCDAYLTLTRDYCDTNDQTISENNWTQTACGGGCADLDTDTRYSGCDAYLTITVDLCDTSASDPIGRNNWAAGCTNCEDSDDDDYYVQCDAYITITEDCDDNDDLINPETNWFRDNDVDGYGGSTPYAGNPVCEDPSNGVAYVNNTLDCNDADPAINPDTLWYFDGDHDGWGNPAVGLAVESCTDPGANYVFNNADCNDNNANITTLTWYADGDGDTYGDPLTEGYGCTVPPGHVANDDDCNDDSSAIKPGATETCGDGVDQNCDGQGGPSGDDDGDGLTWTQENGASISDCDDDSDNDGVTDTLEWGNLASPTPRNTDGDSLPDVRDLDDDGDGILTTFESHDDLDGAPECGFAPDGLPSYIDVDSDGDGVCDGSYTPIATECVEWSLFDRDSVEPGVQAFPDYHNLDNDSDGVPNAYDYDDFDGGACDADGDGLASLVEVNTCYTPAGESEVCLDPSDSDTNHDGVVDGLEVGPNTNSPLDSDDDGIPDWWDLDDDGDLVPTADEDYETPPDGDPTNEDTDGDGIDDYLDDDDDGDGLLTKDEDVDGDGDPRNDDFDGDLVPDYIDLDDQDGPLGDHDGDGVTNHDEEDGGTDPDDPDTDGDGVLDGLEWKDGSGNRLDTDGDLIADALDLDDDGDGIPTLIEGSWDADNDGLGNNVDTDSDADGSDDRAEGGDAWEAEGVLPDTDSDGLPDFLDTDPDIFWTEGEGPGPGPEPPNCACGAVPTPAGAWGGLGVLALAALRRRRR